MRSTLTGLIFAISLFSEAHAESLSYSGRIVNNNGSPVSGTPTLRFELASTLDTSAILCSDQITGVALTVTHSRPVLQEFTHTHLRLLLPVELKLETKHFYIV